MDEEKERIQEVIQGVENRSREFSKQVYDEEYNNLTKNVDSILSLSPEERYNKMIEEQKEKIEQNFGIVIADIFKDELDYMIDNKEKYIAEFTEEKEKWESMSEGERENKIELEALLKEKSSAYPESYLKRIQYEDVYNTVSDDTREAIDVVHEMTGKQLYKKDEIKQNMYSLFAGSAVFGTIAGLYEGIVEQSLSAGGEALVAGGAFGFALSGLLVAGTKGIGAIKARKIIKQYPEAVKYLKELDIYDLVMKKIASENGYEWYNYDEFQDKVEGRSL